MDAKNEKCVLPSKRPEASATGITTKEVRMCQDTWKLPPHGCWWKPSRSLCFYRTSRACQASAEWCSALAVETSPREIPKIPEPINNQCHPSKANLPKRRHLGTGVATCSLWIIEGEPVWTHKMLDDFGVFHPFLGDIYIYIYTSFWAISMNQPTIGN